MHNALRRKPLQSSSKYVCTKESSSCVLQMSLELFNMLISICTGAVSQKSLSIQPKLYRLCNVRCLMRGSYLQLTLIDDTLPLKWRLSLSQLLHFPQSRVQLSPRSRHLLPLPSSPSPLSSLKTACTQSPHKQKILRFITHNLYINYHNSWISASV